jgi:hypothetical protein
MVELRRLKLRNVARRIWFLADNLKAALPDPSLPDRYQSESLSGVLTGLFGKPADAKGLFLLEQSALALRVASKLDHEESNAGEAISDAVAETSRVQGDLIRAVMG